MPSNRHLNVKGKCFRIVKYLLSDFMYKEREAVMDPKKRQRISAIIIVIVIAALVVTSIVPMMI